MVALAACVAWGVVCCLNRCILRTIALRHVRVARRPAPLLLADAPCICELVLPQ